LQQKRLVALQGFELDALKSSRIALLFLLTGSGTRHRVARWIPRGADLPCRLWWMMKWQDDIGLVHNQRVVSPGKAGSKGRLSSTGWIFRILSMRPALT
jgi:Mlc titration factor MtfA (ptsG expression regulator)